MESTPDRFYGEGDASYRNNIIQLFEQEYHTTTNPEMQWGPQDTYFQREGSIFYSKSQLLRLSEEDKQNQLEDAQNPTIQNSKDVLEGLIGHKISDDELNPKFIINIIKTKPSGLPRLVGFTKNFYQFENVCLNEITPDNITKEILQKIQDTFVDEYNPLLSNIDGGIYEKDGSIHLTDITKWSYNPSHKLGVYFIPKASELYGTETALFFPFGVLSEKDIEIINALNTLQNEGKEVRIITL